MVELADLRARLEAAEVDAFICFTDDSHASETPCAHDNRRQVLTGFTGSAGTALIGMHHAWLWVDGRYHLQAAAEISTEWTLMKDGLPDTPTIPATIKATEAITRVGFDPLCSPFQSIADFREKSGKDFVNIANPVDELWVDRPAPPSGPISHFGIEHAGMTTDSKLAVVRKKLEQQNATHLALAALDDVSWLCNLRAADVPNTPFVRGYVIVSKAECVLFVEESRLTPEAVAALAENGVTTRPYEEFIPALKELPSASKIVLNKTASCFVEVVPEENRVMVFANCVSQAKAVKNSVELEGFKSCHVLDGVAVCRYLTWLFGLHDEELARLNEFSAATRLGELRREADDNRGLSFTSISSVEANAAVIHYHPTETKNSPMSRGLYLIDSGGQYVTGTTDVTRTVHLGCPTDEQREMFTRVLMGHIDLAMSHFPQGTRGFQLDALARTHLWHAHANYMHGTGHGVGHYLSVHEGPCSISMRAAGASQTTALEPGMVLSNEPGYYKDGEFGIRHENMVFVREEDTGWLSFGQLTFVPFQTECLSLELMAPEHVAWLNAYHRLCMDKIGGYIKSHRSAIPDADATLAWLERACRPVDAVERQPRHFAYDGL